MSNSRKNFLIAREIKVIFKFILAAIIVTLISIPFLSKDEIEAYKLKRDYEAAKKANKNLIPFENKIQELYYSGYLNQEGNVTTPSGRTIHLSAARTSDGCVYVKMITESEAKEVINYDCLLENKGKFFSSQKTSKYLKVFFWTLIFLLLLRYIIKSVKWVNRNSKEDQVV